jgi:hypothetical protein
MSTTNGSEKHKIRILSGVKIPPHIPVEQERKYANRILGPKGKKVSIRLLDEKWGSK